MASLFKESPISPIKPHSTWCCYSVLLYSQHHVSSISDRSEGTTCGEMPTSKENFATGGTKLYAHMLSNQMPASRDLMLNVVTSLNDFFSLAATA